MFPPPLSWLDQPPPFCAHFYSSASSEANIQLPVWEMQHEAEYSLKTPHWNIRKCRTPVSVHLFLFTCFWRFWSCFQSKDSSAVHSSCFKLPVSVHSWQTSVLHLFHNSSSLKRQKDSELSPLVRPHPSSPLLSPPHLLTPSHPPPSLNFIMFFSALLFSFRPLLHFHCVFLHFSSFPSSFALLSSFLSLFHFPQIFLSSPLPHFFITLFF